MHDLCNDEGFPRLSGFEDKTPAVGQAYCPAEPLGVTRSHSIQERELAQVACRVEAGEEVHHVCVLRCDIAPPARDGLRLFTKAQRETLVDEADVHLLHSP